MSNPVRIESKDVPKYAYKVYNHFSISILKTYFRHVHHVINKFNKGNGKKRSHKTILHVNSALHIGRISVFVDEIDAIHFCINRNGYYVSQAWKVEIKQTTKYAYKGSFADSITLAIDQVKPIKRVH